MGRRQAIQDNDFARRFEELWALPPGEARDNHPKMNEFIIAVSGFAQGLARSLKCKDVPETDCQELTIQAAWKAARHERGNGSHIYGFITTIARRDVGKTAKSNKKRRKREQVVIHTRTEWTLDKNPSSVLSEENPAERARQLAGFVYESMPRNMARRVFGMKHGLGKYQTPMTSEEIARKCRVSKKKVAGYLGQGNKGFKLAARDLLTGVINPKI